MPNWNSRLEAFYRFIAHSLTRLIFRPTYIGFDKIPDTGPAIIICNHVSYVDGLIIAAGSKRHIRFIIDEEIFKLPGVNYFMTLDKAIPIFPTREKVEKALNEVSEGLRNGDIICIFPEGQLTYTGSLGRFRPGIEWIIRRDPVPVYPMAINGLWGSIFSRKYRKARFRWFPRSLTRPITAIMGEPIAPEDVKVNQLQETVLRLKYSL